LSFPDPLFPLHFDFSRAQLMDQLLSRF